MCVMEKDRGVDMYLFVGIHQRELCQGFRHTFGNM